MQSSTVPACREVGRLVVTVELEMFTNVFPGTGSAVKETLPLTQR